MLENGFVKEYGKYVMDEFEFECGEVLADVAVEYLIKGTPKFDDDGNIVNAVIFCHGFNENSKVLNNFSIFIKEGASFDVRNYFFISITTLGFPGSCSPSSTGLKHNFPKYSIKDRVEFKRQFLKEKFNLSRVHGVLGHELGGYEVYTWACEYPDEMDFIIIESSSFKTNGYRYVLSKGFDSIIEASGDFYNETYSESLSRTMVSIYKMLYSNYFAKRIFQEMSNDEIDVLMDDFVDEGLFVDIYDFKYRNDCISDYNVEDKLGNIKASALIISPNDDLYFTPEFDTVPVKDLIADSKIVVYDSKRDYTDYEDFSFLMDDLSHFLKEVENKKR